MNNKSVRELRALAKDRGLKGYYKLKKAELIDLLDTQQKPPLFIHNDWDTDNAYSDNTTEAEKLWYFFLYLILMKGYF